MLEIILVVLALIAIVGACVYFYTDMKDHKATNNTDFDKVNKNIEEEEATRLGNIKYVVDQVNNTNTAMDTEYDTRFKKLEDTGTGFGKLIVAENASGGVVPFKDITDTDGSKLKLMRDVSVIGSMSIKDLQIAHRTSNSLTPSFKACGVAGSPCIQFPDSSGDTFLTAFTTDKSVVSGSIFKANAGLMTDTINNLTATNNLKISTGALGNEIVVGKATADGIKLTSGGSSIEINNGAINITASSFSNIKLNSQSIDVVSVPEDGRLDPSTKVLTLAGTATTPTATTG
jgi:hypothetical protein